MQLTGDLEEKILENIIEVANEIEDDVEKTSDDTFVPFQPIGQVADTIANVNMDDVAKDSLEEKIIEHIVDIATEIKDKVDRNNQELVPNKTLEFAFSHGSEEQKSSFVITDDDFENVKTSEDVIIEASEDKNEIGIENNDEILENELGKDDFDVDIAITNENEDDDDGGDDDDIETESEDESIDDDSEQSLESEDSEEVLSLEENVKLAENLDFENDTERNIEISEDEENIIINESLNLEQEEDNPDSPLMESNVEDVPIDATEEKLEANDDDQEDEIRDNDVAIETMDKLEALEKQRDELLKTLQEAKEIGVQFDQDENTNSFNSILNEDDESTEEALAPVNSKPQRIKIYD